MDDLGNAFKKTLLNDALETEDAITIVVFVIDDNVTCFSWKSYLSIKKFKNPKKQISLKLPFGRLKNVFVARWLFPFLPFSPLSPSNPMGPEISVVKVGRIETDNRNM